MLRLTTPKSGNHNLFYVSSESGGDQHIVVRHGSLFFCDCRDFMVRRLPVIGTSAFETCKHGQFVADITGHIPEGTDIVFAVRNKLRDTVVANAIGLTGPR